MHDFRNYISFVFCERQYALVILYQLLVTVFIQVRQADRTGAIQPLQSDSHEG